MQYGVICNQASEDIPRALNLFDLHMWRQLSGDAR